MTNYQFLNSYTFNNGVTLKNKIVMAPMTTMASFHNGMLTQDELDYYETRSGGPGMIITAVANVSDSGKGFEGELSVAHDEMMDGLTQLASVLKKNGSKAVLQIFHAGRKSTTKILRGETPVSASAIAAEFPTNSETPRELTHEEIEEIITDFGEATRRAIIAGFDGIELHGANTYLLQQFYSEHSNRRSDEWGGSRDKRMTFALRVIAEVQKAIDTYATKPFLLGYRVSPEEVETPGIRLEDTLYFAETIKDKIDYLHLSMGDYKRTSINNPDDKTPIIEHFTKTINGDIPLIGIGSVERPEQADEVLELGTDLVAIGREFLREPKWVQKVMAQDEGSIRTQISPLDLDELRIPKVTQEYLKVAFRSVMHFTTDPDEYVNYQNQLAPMEGIEKKI
ncbi:NADH-dependent flavin oxidoreductase [Vagococcus hydrophili]|uniref:NADH-dependent flavin oxidoreductase n=1 Tax=Vagococcus hydrophili TaxID=2714947 RepID=A0A6G8ATP1_9ENTE|nr:NADH-dependent flavin oxidoreductase [Vagococcus hydrophili]QIL48305.1 NADH-dependent flavin oxidoreductase [Vagococcus hydrophili]